MMENNNTSTGWLSMREVTQRTLVNDVLKSVRTSGVNYRVLVVDYRATRVLSSCLRVTDITELGIALVESLEKGRQPFQDMEVIYLCEPSENSIERIIRDFEGAPLYHKVHFFFLSRISDELLGKIKSNPGLRGRILTLTEINLNYLAVEDNCFHLDMPTAMVSVYNEEKIFHDTSCNRIVEELVTFCASMREYPFIRYDAKNSLTTTMAESFQQKFNMMLNTNNTFTWRGGGFDGPGDLKKRAILLILDRSYDPVTPLSHFFSYQAMVNDLMNIDGDVCKYYKGDMKAYTGQDMFADADKRYPGSVKVCLLNDEDPLWKEFRHLHIAEVIQRLSSYLEQYMETTVGKMTKRADGEPVASLEEMNRAVQELPQYKEMMEKHSQHLQITRLCMHKLEKQYLLKCADVEQIMLTGVEKDASEVSKQTLQSRIIELAKDPAIGVTSTVRLIGLYLITQKDITESDRRAVLEAANPAIPSSMQDALLSLTQFGSKVHEGGINWNSSFIQNRTAKVKEAKEYARNCKYANSRFQPLLQDLLASLCEFRLSKDAYPYVIEPPPSIFDAPAAEPTTPKTGASFSLFGNKQAKPVAAPASPPAAAQSNLLSVRSKGKAKPAAAAAASPSSAPSSAASSPIVSSPKRATVKRNVNDSRIIVFVVGGITHAELAAVSHVVDQTGKDVIIGSTHILKPETFVQDLSYLPMGNTQKYFDEVEAKMAEKFKKVPAAQQEPTAITDSQADAPKPKRSIWQKMGCGCMSAPPASTN